MGSATRVARRLNEGRKEERNGNKGERINK
jgi:hypothetical protein